MEGEEVFKFLRDCVDPGPNVTRNIFPNTYLLASHPHRFITPWRDVTFDARRS
jgi:hypothetical protein